MKRIITLAALFFLLTLPNLLMAQPPPLLPDPAQTPIDGGLGILAALGGGYAIKKLQDRKKADNS